MAGQRNACRFGLLDMAITTLFELFFLLLSKMAGLQDACHFGLVDIAITTLFELLRLF